ncbi:MAG: hypothetical protein Kow0059_06420 [Candidatus Sumerlaeia bacterium]
MPEADAPLQVHPVLVRPAMMKQIHHALEQEAINGPAGISIDFADNAAHGHGSSSGDRRRRNRRG